MASLRQIRRRMKSVESINEITKAMQMISTFRFKRAETRFTKIRSYLMEMENILANVSAAATKLDHPLFEKRPIKKRALIVMTGDKGLCGAYNANLLRTANNWLKADKITASAYIPVGKIGYESYRKRRFDLLLTYPEKAAADLMLAKKMTEELKALYLSGKVDSIDLLYTTFKSGGSGSNRIVPFLPLNYLVEGKKENVATVDYIYEPDAQSVFYSLLEKFLEGKVYLTLLESLTSEYNARMMAMKQASENGEEVLDDLKLLRNKTRQATITRELSEIVGGASILV